MKKIIWLAIIVVLAIIIVGYLVGFYNNLVKQSTAIDNQWAQVENQFQRRFDLIPNLVASVQGAMAQEQNIFTALAEARTKYAGAQTIDEKATAAGEVEGALGRLLVIMENYPQLKSIDTVQTLMVQLEGTENRIAVERGRYNDVVAAYNAKIAQVPGNILAPIFGFKARQYFKAAEGAQTAPQVDLIN